MKKSIPYLVLLLRPILFLVAQVAIALYFLVAGDDNPWNSSAKYWITYPVFANIITILVLKYLYKQEGLNYFSIFRFQKKNWWKDLLISVVIFIGASIFAMVPNTVLSSVIFGSQEATSSLLFNKIPTWAIWIAFLWPITHPFAELPLYFDFSMNRIGSNPKNGMGALLICSLALAFQHITLPLILDFRYLVWRFGMFLLLAIYVGIVLKVRPKLLPYMVVGHGLLDLPLVIMFFGF